MEFLQIDLICVGLFCWPALQHILFVLSHLLFSGVFFLLSLIRGVNQGGFTLPLPHFGVRFLFVTCRLWFGSGFRFFIYWFGEYLFLVLSFLLQMFISILCIYLPIVWGPLFLMSCQL